MNAIERIRKEVFSLTQSEFAAAIGVAQPTVSRWERGVPMALPVMIAIRELAFNRGLHWDDRWFFEMPTEVIDAAPATSCPVKSGAHFSQEGAR